MFILYIRLPSKCEVQTTKYISFNKRKHFGCVCVCCTSYCCCYVWNASIYRMCADSMRRNVDANAVREKKITFFFSSNEIECLILVLNGIRRIANKLNINANINVRKRFGFHCMKWEKNGIDARKDVGKQFYTSNAYHFALLIWILFAQRN